MSLGQGGKHRRARHRLVHPLRHRDININFIMKLKNPLDLGFIRNNKFLENFLVWVLWFPMRYLDNVSQNQLSAFSWDLPTYTN